MGTVHTPVTSPALIRPSEAARRLGVNTNTLLNWRKRGIGPRPIILGLRSTRYRAVDIARLIDGPPATGAAQ